MSQETLAETLVFAIQAGLLIEWQVDGDREGATPDSYVLEPIPELREQIFGTQIQLWIEEGQ